MFPEHARGRHVYPAYGCHMFCVSMDVVLQHGQRMRGTMFPHGLDLWFFASPWMEDERLAFTIRSKGGQRQETAIAENQLGIRTSGSLRTRLPSRASTYAECRVPT